MGALVVKGSKMSSFQIFQSVMLALIAVTGAGIVLTRNPKRQILIGCIFGVLQAVLFFAMHSPDVALSEAAVGIIALPSLVLAVLARLEKAK